MALKFVVELKYQEHLQGCKCDNKMLIRQNLKKYVLIQQGPVLPHWTRASLRGIFVDANRTSRNDNLCH